MIKDVDIDKDQLKTFLAGLCMASLTPGSALMVSGCGTKATALNGTKPDAGGVQKEQPAKPAIGKEESHLAVVLASAAGQPSISLLFLPMGRFMPAGSFPLP